MRRTWIGIWTVVLFALVLVLVTYPVGALFRTKNMVDAALMDFEVHISSMEDKSLRHQKNLARWYNLHFQREDISDTYDTILNFGGGIMGTLEIPSLGVKLPIYRQITTAGVTHDPGSALPVGGRGNVTAFYGLGDLSELAKGELVYIRVLNETHVYAAGEAGSDICLLRGRNRTGQELTVSCSRVDPQREQQAAAVPGMVQSFRDAVTIAVAAAMGAGMVPLIVSLLRWRIRQRKDSAKVKL